MSKLSCPSRQITIFHKILTNFNKIIKPYNCVLAFGIPTSEQEFYQDILQPNKEFVKYCCSGWPKYYYEVVSLIEHITPKLQALGVNIVNKLTLNEFARLFQENRFSVIILVAHWKKEDINGDEFIEFYDGLANVYDVANQIPQDFSGILDLSVCNPEKLALILRNRKVLTRYIPKRTIPYIWLSFYTVLFDLLYSHNLAYFDAFEIIANEILDQNKKH